MSKRVNKIDEKLDVRYRNVGLLDRRPDQCCYPVGKKTGKHIVFCGRKAKPTIGCKPVWCDKHRKKGYRRKKHGTAS